MEGLATFLDASPDKGLRVAVVVALQRQGGSGFDRLANTKFTAQLLQVQAPVPPCILLTCQLLTQDSSSWVCASPAWLGSFCDDSIEELPCPHAAVLHGDFMSHNGCAAAPQEDCWPLDRVLMLARRAWMPKASPCTCSSSHRPLLSPAACSLMRCAVGAILRMQSRRISGQRRLRQQGHGLWSRRQRLPACPAVDRIQLLQLPGSWRSMHSAPSTPAWLSRYSDRSLGPRRSGSGPWLEPNSHACF